VNRAGYVLVGGRSARMGRDKALLPFRGGVLAEWVAREVAAVAGGVVLVGDPGRYAAFGYAVIPDRYPGEGPLGGILTALAHTTAEWNLVVACDMPKLSAEFLGRILEAAAGQSAADALVPTGPSGLPEPLCAAYHRRSRAALEGAFERGERKVMRALATLPVVMWPMAELAPFQNVNTPEDWAGYVAE
jgi:molybdopterin-guanine dinucleotide biosynthesis protein A